MKNKCIFVQTKQENMQKSHWRNLTSEKYLGSWDLEQDGKFIEATLTIEKIFSGEMVGQMGKQQKPFIKFKELAKSMICNKTNFKRLEKRFGTFDYSKYIGQKVVLGVENVDSPDGKVDALRIKTKAPADTSKPVQRKTITDERLDEAIKAILDESNTAMTSEVFLSKYELTDVQMMKFIELC